MSCAPGKTWELQDGQGKKGLKFVQKNKNNNNNNFVAIP